MKHVLKPAAAGAVDSVAVGAADLAVAAVVEAVAAEAETVAGVVDMAAAAAVVAADAANTKSSEIKRDAGYGLRLFICIEDFGLK